nr:probable nucleolar protein 5-2 [Ipomoea batatas]
MELMRGLSNQLTELISGLAVQDLAPMSLGLCIVQDNIFYAKTVKLMGDRTNATKLDFSEIFPEEVETELKGAAMISMGTEVSDIHLMNIKDLCNQVLSFS